MEKNKIKAELIKQCKDKVQEEITVLQNAMKDAQEVANQFKGAMESRYDTFKEEAQNRKDAYGRQLHEMTKVMSLILSIDNSNLLTRVEQGAIVITDKYNFFICYNIFDDGIEIDGTKYITINLASPIGQQLKNKTSGSSVTLNKITFTILDIF